MANNLIRSNPFPEWEASFGWITLGKEIVMMGRELEWKDQRRRGKKGAREGIWGRIAKMKGHFEGSYGSYLCSRSFYQKQERPKI